MGNERSECAVIPRQQPAANTISLLYKFSLVNARNRYFFSRFDSFFLILQVRWLVPMR